MFCKIEHAGALKKEWGELSFQSEIIVSAPNFLYEYKLVTEFQKWNSNRLFFKKYLFIR